MKNLANRYATLQKKMKEEAENLEGSIKVYKGMKKMWKTSIAQLRRPPTNLSPNVVSPSDKRKMIRDLESVIQKIDKKIESIKMRLRKVGKRYSMIKRKTILNMAKNLSATTKK